MGIIVVILWCSAVLPEGGGELNSLIWKHFLPANCGNTKTKWNCLFSFHFLFISQIFSQAAFCRPFLELSLLIEMFASRCRTALESISGALLCDGRSIRSCVHFGLMYCTGMLLSGRLSWPFCCWQKISPFAAKGWRRCMQYAWSCRTMEKEVNTRSAFWIQMLGESIGWMRST